MSDDAYQKADFAYYSKASSSERNAGCEHLKWKREDGEFARISKEEYERLQEKKDRLIEEGKRKEARNIRITEGSIHSTVKPVDIMEWLFDKLDVEPGDKVLDPFAGSGTTGVAAIEKEVDCHLIELDENGKYEDIIKGRLKHKREEKLSDYPVGQSPPDIEIPLSEEEEEEIEQENLEEFPLFSPDSS